MRSIPWFTSVIAATLLAASTVCADTAPSAQPASGAPLRGFADLHTHPAVHFAFGRRGADEGLFWGKPGMSYSTADKTIADDLKACAGGGDPNLVGSISHGLGADFDATRHGTHQKIIQQLDAQTGASHTRDGWPNLSSWPSSSSVLHEQMHVTMLHRAWQGGLRLMVASAVDNQMITRLWANGYNLFGNSLPNADPKFDFDSAKQQLGWIKEFARANSDWMTVVSSSVEASQAIASGKLAVILGVEMDSLTPDQILELVKGYGVRTAIPIHLTDNPSFGGAAVYVDLFNTTNRYLNGRFFQVEGDPRLADRIGPPSLVESPSECISTLLVGCGQLQPNPLSYDEFCKLGYKCCKSGQRSCVPDKDGHKNALGLASQGEAALLRLMRQGVIIDIAHMSEKSTDGALRLAEQHAYPMMNSHSGFRDEQRCASNERSMRFDQGKRLAKLGGMFGLGTGGSSDQTVVLAEAGSTLFRFTGDKKSHTWSLSAPVTGRVDKVKFTIRTGGDDLRDARTAYGVVHLKGGKKEQFVLNNDGSWGNGSTTTVIHDVNVAADDIEQVGVHTTFGGGMGGDNWNMDALDVAVRIDGRWRTILNEESAQVRFTGDFHDHMKGATVRGSAELNTCQVSEGHLAGDAPVAALAVTLVTGGDDLRGGNDNANAKVTLHNGKHFEFPLNRGAKWSNGITTTVLGIAPEGTRVSDLASFTIETTFRGGVGGDNWNLDQLTVNALGDPIPNWINAYAQARAIMGGRGVAVGTDMNGLAPQFPFSVTPVKYPLDAAQKAGVPRAERLPQDKLGNRTFRFREDGVAHIGMLPDFLGALSDGPNGQVAVNGLLSSANDFVEMWRKVESAASRIPK